MRRSLPEAEKLGGQTQKVGKEGRQKRDWPEAVPCPRVGSQARAIPGRPGDEVLAFAADRLVRRLFF
ncbi:MAG TPA: hypothetical protein VFX17_01275 [Patescibacteria group bacterium]|nr:hypothetical protein [Patescibacteria group bacterium]